MGKISNSTVQRILEATDIVEVVSDFVSLKRKGANYWGLCPFHNDRSPSFSVSKSRGLCKCFSCGEGGSAVNFLMKLEHLSYTEALRYLARKYNIEVEEREMTPEEERRENARDNMLAVNEFALRYFKNSLTETTEGRDVGLSYFRHRGISDPMIERFHLGYAPEAKDALFNQAIERGYSEEYLISTGLSSKTDDGRVFDRFRGRVIYPIHTLSGKVVAFGGRTLRSDKTMAKYVNSPESDIYSKRRELYGLFQAKQAISKEGKCIIVEGYMDVISMHQAGVCNVVASSGTALTVEQVRLIKRFTTNVTLIYDSDAAGIKASLRGIELLLQDGMDIKVLLLPPGEDPDSFAQSHSSTEVTDYIKENETDFITFMAQILLKDVGDDPTARANVITRIVKTIALIPNEITRSVYVQECARILFISEDVLQRQVGKYFNEFALKSREDRMREESLTAVREEHTPSAGQAVQPQAPATQPDEAPATSSSSYASVLRPYEKGVLQLIARYGNYPFAEGVDENGDTVPLSVLEYIDAELEMDDIRFTNPDLAHFLDVARRISRESWEEHYRHEEEKLKEIRASKFRSGIEEIRAKATDLGSITAMERSLNETIDAEYARGLEDFSATYLSTLLCSSPDDSVRNLATELVIERHTLSKVHTKYAHVETEREQLGDLVPRTIHELKNAILGTRIKAEREKLASCPQNDFERIFAIMREIQTLEALRIPLAKLIGDRVIAPGH